MTPLWKKLGLKPGHKIWVIGAPKSYQDFFGTMPQDLVFVGAPDTAIDVIHIFASSAQILEDYLNQAKPHLKKNGMLWISWPKKSSAIPSDIGKFDVMRAGQASGLVDVKVAAIDADWSGHKFVYRVNDR